MSLLENIGRDGFAGLSKQRFQPGGWRRGGMLRAVCFCRIRLLRYLGEVLSSPGRAKAEQATPELIRWRGVFFGWNGGDRELVEEERSVGISTAQILFVRPREAQPSTRETTQIYTHLMARPGIGAPSPLDRCEQVRRLVPALRSLRSLRLMRLRDGILPQRTQRTRRARAVPAPLAGARGYDKTAGYADAALHLQRAPTDRRITLSERDRRSNRSRC
jgi:hypothetical protein